MREISKACASTGVIWATNFHAMKPLIDFGTEEQKRRLLPVMAEGGLASLTITEPTAGSDATGMKTEFRPEGDHIVVNGAKTFITNGAHADLYMLFGKWSEIEDGRKAISALVVEKGTPGLEVVREEDKMGLRASSTAALAFDGCRVPRANLLGKPGDGLKILLASLNKSRPSVAAHALGIARARSKTRSPTSTSAANRAAASSSSRAYSSCWPTWRPISRCAKRGCGTSRAWSTPAPPDFGVEASMLKMRASDLAMRIATDAVQLHGGYGYCKDYRVERLMRDAKITQIWEGTNQIHRQFIGRSFREEELIWPPKSLWSAWRAAARWARASRSSRRAPDSGRSSTTRAPTRSSARAGRPKGFSRNRSSARS